MFPLVEFPELVQHYAPYFKDVFSPEAFIEFERYISGLIVFENKTVEGINRLMVVEKRNQSSLNRLLTKSPYELKNLNQARLNVMNSLPGTKMKPNGVFSLDDTLLIHYGDNFEKIAKLWDHVSGTYVWAHDLVTIHYSDDDTDYPAAFQIWEPVELEKLEQGIRAAQIKIKPEKEALKKTNPHKWRGYLLGVWRRREKKHPELQELYDSKIIIAQKLLQGWVENHPDELHPVTFDNWFTQPAFCQFLDQTLHLAYVGTLADGDQVNLSTGGKTLKEFAEHLKQEHLDAIQRKAKPVFHKIGIPFKGKNERYYSYCNTHNIHNFGRQRLVINYRQADLSDNPAFYISNRLIWQAAGITRIRRHRWPVEVYHEEGKDEGLDQYQLRDFNAIQRHIALVAVVYSLLRASQHDPNLRERLQRQLKISLEDNPAAWRRVSQAQSLWCLGLFLSAGLTQGQSLEQLLKPLVHVMCKT
ncbi:MAG: transposase [Chlorobiales bacterium]|nr:transposase [Chlorobiales bacterium]